MLELSLKTRQMFHRCLVKTCSSQEMAANSQNQPFPDTNMIKMYLEGKIDYQEISLLGNKSSLMKHTSFMPPKECLLYTLAYKGSLLPQKNQRAHMCTSLPKQGAPETPRDSDLLKDQLGMVRGSGRTPLKQDPGAHH